jgi:predicted acyltransferase
LAACFLCGWLFQALCPPAPTQKSIWSIFLSPPGDTGAHFYSLANLRIPGVLQRLALVYLAVALLALHSGWRLQAALAGALLLLYWGLLSLTGFGLELGRDLGACLDRAVFGQAHLYAPDWDPEGLLSTLPAIATGLLGALAGHWLKSAREWDQKFMGLLLFGLLAIAAGKLWGLAFPINKNLWTSSFVLYSGGFALLCLGAFYYWFDVKQANLSLVRPFAWLGTKPLLAYVGSQVMFLGLYTLYVGTPAEHTSFLTLIHNGLFGENWDILGETAWRDPRWPSLLWGLVCLSFWTLLAGPVYRKAAWRPIPLKPAAREVRVSMHQVEYWDADHIPGGYLGG